MARLEISHPNDATGPFTAKVLTDECRDQTSDLLQTVLNDAPALAVVDLDGDGRDEVFLLGQGNTIQYAVVLRVDGCRVARVWTENDPSNDGQLPFHVSGAPGGGAGVFCRRTAAGSVEVLQILQSPWGEVDTTDEERPTYVEHDHAFWIRTTFVLRGNRLVSTGEERGTTRIHDDPSVPLINHFECLGPARL